MVWGLYKCHVNTEQDSLAQNITKGLVASGISPDQKITRRWSTSKRYNKLITGLNIKNKYTAWITNWTEWNSKQYIQHWNFIYVILLYDLKVSFLLDQNNIVNIYDIMWRFFKVYLSFMKKYWYAGRHNVRYYNIK